MMKKWILAVLATAMALAAFGQAKKPTLMVVPSDVWATQNGYMLEYDDMGAVRRMPDYEAALSGDANLNLAISKLGEMMAERGFPLKDLGQVLRRLHNEEAEYAVATSSETGDVLAESPLDRLKRTADADIWIQLTYTVNKTGPKQSLTFNLQGFDAYTDKQIAAASGTGMPSISVEVPVLLTEAVLSHIDGFNHQLQNHFDDLFANGREVVIEMRRWNGSDVSFESEYDGDELGFLIEDWMAENTVNGRFSTSTASENRMLFEQVRIPLENDRGRAMDTRTWANGLRRYLQSTCGIDAKLSTEGLGKAIITIGGK